MPVQIPSQTPDLAGNYWPRLQWSQLFGFPPASLLVGQESPPPPSVTPGAVPRPLLASLGIPTQSTQHQAPSTPATTPVHNSDTSEWNEWLFVTCLLSRSDRCPRLVRRDDHDATSYYTTHAEEREVLRRSLARQRDANRFEDAQLVSVLRGNKLNPEWRRTRDCNMSPLSLVSWKFRLSILRRFSDAKRSLFLPRTFLYLNCMIIIIDVVAQVFHTFPN